MRSRKGLYFDAQDRRLTEVVVDTKVWFKVKLGLVTPLPVCFGTHRSRICRFCWLTDLDCLRVNESRLLAARCGLELESTGLSWNIEFSHTVSRPCASVRDFESMAGETPLNPIALPRGWFKTGHV